METSYPMKSTTPPSITFTPSKDCLKSKWIGDTNCDDENNFPECNYDGGDCCTDTRHFHCKECKCIVNRKICYQTNFI